MKEIMSGFLVLYLPNFSKPFVLECDSPLEGIGVVLMQERHLIAFKRKTLQTY